MKVITETGQTADRRSFDKLRTSVVRAYKTWAEPFGYAQGKLRRSILLETGILVLGLTLIFPTGVPMCLPPEPAPSASSGQALSPLTEFALSVVEGLRVNSAEGVWCEWSGVVNPVPFWVSMVVMDALLVWMGWNDFKTQRVPNLITLPLMTVGIVRAVVFRDPTFLVYWGVLGLLWMAHFMGGGDAKFLMALFGLFPDLRLVWIMGASILVTGIPYLVWKYRGRWRASLRRMVWRLVTLQLLPSGEELEQEGVPYAFSISLAGAVYLFLRSGEAWISAIAVR